MVEFKETRGRKRIYGPYEYPSSPGEQIVILIDKDNLMNVRTHFYHHARINGMKYRTWMSEGKLIVECVDVNPLVAIMRADEKDGLYNTSAKSE